MDNEYTLNNCVVKEEVDLTLEEEREDEDEEEEEEEEEEDTNCLVKNYDQNENNVIHNQAEFIQFDDSKSKSIVKFSTNSLYRSIKPGCQSEHCKLKCRDISQYDKQAIFQHFWYTLNLDEKLEFISCHIGICAGVKRSRRNYFFKLNKRLKKVCYKTFLGTLDINKSWILNSLKKFQRTPNDTMSHFMSTICKEGKLKVENNEIENSPQQKEDIVLDSSKIQQTKELPLGLIKVKNTSELQSHNSKENDNYEFETIFLNSDANSASQNFKTKTIEGMDESTTNEIKEIKCENIEELNDDDKNSNVNSVNISKILLNDSTTSREPCRSCKACFFPQEQKKYVSQHLWKIKSYFGKIQYLSNHIKAIKSEQEKFTYEFFLEFDSSQSIKVCVYGFQNILSVCDDWIVAAIKKVHEYCSKQISENENVSNKILNDFDKKLTHFWKKAKILKDIFYTRTKNQMEQYNDNLLCDEQCELFCQITKNQWTEISNEFWNIKTVEELRKYILNHVQFFSLTNKPCRKYFLKIDGKLKKVCKSFFLESLSIKNEIIELIGAENNAIIINSIDNEPISNQSKIKLNTEGNCLIGRKVRIPCDAFYHNNCRKILEEERQRMFHKFWFLNDDMERYNYIAKYVQIISNDSNSNCHLYYFLEINEIREKVCQIMFEATFDINDKWIKTALQTLGLIPQDFEKKTINFTLKRSLSRNLILKKIKKIANSNSREATETEGDDPEIIDISNDSIDNYSRFEIAMVKEEPKETQSMELVKIKAEEQIEIETVKRIKIETTESLEMNVEEILETKKLKEEIIEVNSDDEEIMGNESEIDLEELVEMEEEDEEIIQINSEGEEILNEFQVDFKNMKKEIRKFPLSRKKRGKFCNNKCENECYLTNDICDDIFNYFWNIGSRYHKFEFISRHVDVDPVINRVKKIMTMNINCFLEINSKRIMVCQETFISILGINKEWIHNVLNYFGRNLYDSSMNEKQRLKSLNSKDISKSNIDSVVAFEAGLPYLTSKGTSLPGRKLRKACNNKCEFKCKEFSHRQREEIFHNFWNISCRRKKYDYLWNHIKKISFENTKNVYNGRQFFFEINGEIKEVCPTMFTGTLDIDIVWVEKLDQLRKSVTY